jgi:hypothetical protein
MEERQVNYVEQIPPEDWGKTPISVKKLVEEMAQPSVKTNIKIYDSIGCTLQESVMYFSIIDFYFSPMGSGQVKYFFIGNKPGITHAPCNLNLLNSSSLVCQELLWRENATIPFPISQEFISIAIAITVRTKNRG